MLVRDDARRATWLPAVLSVVAAVAVAIAAFVYLAPHDAVSVADIGAAELPSEEQNVTTSVFIPLAEWNTALRVVQVTAIVTARVDPNGECAVVAQRGDERVEVSVDAVPDASTMTCANVVVDSASLSPGEWSVTASYSSGDFSADSQPVKVTVPQ